MLSSFTLKFFGANVYTRANKNINKIYKTMLPALKNFSTKTANKFQFKNFYEGLQEHLFKIGSEFRQRKKINLLLAGSTKQKLLRVAIKFFAQKILHKIPCFWDFPFIIFNKRLSAHHFFCSKNDVMKF